MSDKDDDKLIGWLEEQGAISWDGISDDGEALFRFNLEVLKEVMPELYDSIMEDINSDLMSFYQEGLVDIEYDENLNVMFKASEKGKMLMEQFNLPPFQD
jgi:hypothetical protein